MDAFGEAREYREDCRQIPTTRARLRPCRDGEMLVHRQRREDSSPLRDENDARCPDVVRSEGGDVSALEHDVSRRRWSEADQGSTQRRLPDAVPPDDGGDSASVDLQVHVVQHVAVAVVRIEADDSQHLFLRVKLRRTAETLAEEVRPSQDKSPERGDRRRLRP